MSKSTGAAAVDGALPIEFPADPTYYGLPASKLAREFSALREAIQRNADATTSHASAWKAAEENGVHKAAAKWALQLDRMSDDKRKDYLRAALDYIAYFQQHGQWGAQAELPLGAPSVRQGDDDADSDAAEDDDFGDAEDASADAADVGPGNPDPDWDGAGTPAAGDIPDQAGHIHAEGEQAGFEGGVEAHNPYPRGSNEARLFAQGVVKGARRRAEAARSDDDDVPSFLRRPAAEARA